MPHLAFYGYSTVEDFLIRYDARRVADLVSDYGQRPGGNITSQIALDALIDILKENKNLQAALYDASEQINMAILVGKRYTRQDLLHLVWYGPRVPSQYSSRVAPLPGGYLVIRLTSDLAFYLLQARRGLTAQDTALLAPLAEPAFKMLAMLRAGERIFDIEDNAIAGKASYVDISPSALPNSYVAKTSRYFGLL